MQKWLRIEKHPNINPTPIQSSATSVQKPDKKSAGFYQQDSSKRRIRFCLSRWLRWSILISCLTFPALSAAVTPCPAQGDNGNPNRVPGISALPGPPLTCAPIAGVNFGNYDTGPAAFTNVFPFLAFLPDNLPRPASTNPVKLALAGDSTGAAIPVASASCAGATLSGTGTTELVVTLADNTSCALTVTWGTAPNTFSFSGATLSRAGDIYSFDGNGELSGGAYGVVPVTTPTTSTQNIPVLGPFGLFAILGGLLWFGRRNRTQSS